MGGNVRAFESARVVVALIPSSSVDDCPSDEYCGYGVVLRGGDSSEWC